MRLSFIYILLFVLTGWGIRANAQANLVLNQANTTGVHTAGQSIVLTDGFSAVSGFHAYISSALNCVPMAAVPSSNQNFIFTVIPREPFTNASSLGSKNICEVMQQVQYFDGLGRPMQNVQVKGSPDLRDVVQPFAYDAFGRESKKYLAYSAAGTANGSYKPDALTPSSGVFNFYNPPGSSGTQLNNGIARIPTPFAETIFEASPLNRVLAQGAPGDAWQPSAGHATKIEYGTNAANEVKLWIISGSGATASHYAANKLYKSTVKDENWIPAYGKGGTIDEYKDLEGRIVLKRVWETDTKGLSTYYVYDDLGSLRYVLPPAVNENSDRISPVNSFAEADNVFKQFIYGYHYDGRKRLIEKKIPGKDWEFMVYNTLDQVVLTQDWKQRSEGKWLFTKYDAFGNSIITGLYNDGRGQAALQATVDSLVISDPNYQWWEERAVSGVGYTNNVFPQTINYYHSINYYGSYSFPGNVFGAPNAGLGQVPVEKTKGLLTGSSVTVLGTTNMLLTVNYYDSEGRVIQCKSQHYKNSSADADNYDEINNVYSFTGELIQSTRKHYNGNTESLYVYNEYAYDHVGRKVSSKQKTGVNSATGNPLVTLSANHYNEIGQLLSKDQGSEAGGPFLDNTQYTYNERGWLKTNQSGLFSMELKYNDGTVPQFNGNISEQVYTNGSANIFSYTYDKLNRLEHSVAGNNLGETISYDVMGNIKTLSRAGYGTNDYNISLYTGNQLKQISGFTNGSYTYNENGNLEFDAPNGNTIAYNYLNLPMQVTGNQNVAYTYDALGRKLRKQSAASGTTDYIDGIHYKTNGDIDFVQTEEGIARNNTGNYSYEYNQTDHLGNVRLSFYKNPSTLLLDVLQRDDYYAFGQRKAIGSTGPNKYLYNSKELQEELGQLDYGARFYDPVIGRFTTIDPSADEEDQESWSPYHYVYNNPIRHTDPDGRIPIPLIGAAVGALTDIALQSVEIALDDNKSFSKDFRYASVGVSAVAGATGVGLVSKLGKLGKVARIGVELAHDAAAAAANQYATEGKISGKSVAASALFGKAAGDVAGKVAGKQAAKTPAAKLLAKEADRAGRVVANGPRASRTAAANAAAKKAANHVNSRAVAAGTASSGVGGKAAEKALEDDKKKR